MVLVEFSVIYAVGGLFAVGMWSLWRSRNRRPHRARSMSFGSSAMISGSFPEVANVSPPIINILLLFSDCPSEEDLMFNMEGVLSFERFRSKTFYDGSSWTFVETEVSLKDHVTSVKIGSESELLAKVDEINKHDFEGYGERPLWSLHRIVNSGTGLSAVLFRVHHVIGDGISLVGISQYFFRDKEGKPFKLEMSERIAGGSKSDSTFGKIIKLTKSIGEVTGLAHTLYDSPLLFTAQDKKHIKMNPANNKTILFPTLRLEFVKALKNAAGVTVNDILLSAFTGALRRYCEYRKDPLVTASQQGTSGLAPAKLQTRALLPVGLPHPRTARNADSKPMRNHWAFVSIQIPVGVQASALERLRACAALTQAMKTAPSAFVQLWIQNNLLSLLPSFVVRQMAFDVFSRHSLVFSNVPGPSPELYTNGKKLMGMQIIFPNLLPQVLLISYNEAVFFNLNVDTSVVLEAEKLPEFFLEELTELATAFGIDRSPSSMLMPKSAGGVFDTTD